MIDHHFSIFFPSNRQIWGGPHIWTNPYSFYRNTHASYDSYGPLLHAIAPLAPFHATLAALSVAHLGVRSEAAAYELRPRQTDAACARNFLWSPTIEMFADSKTICPD